jgi:hypothetical protein
VLLEPLRRWDPEQIGGFVLAGRLGAGAMGQVYLGRSAAGRMVAVKTIKIEFAEEPDFRNRFAHEVAAARRVSGAFTAAVVAADPEADVPWLATAYVPAPSLSILVRACGPLPGPAVRWLAAGCAEALESIHGAGLVHRDLKPSNVLVSPDGPRVIDFGVARAAERIQLTVTRGAVGTPVYMAPEQARDNRQATMASDVYSLGATMLYAATGHGPYHGDTVMDVLVQLATEPPDLGDVPADLADVVAACLERDPRKRPAPAALLAHLAPGLGVDGADGELGPVVLPGQALELIAEYRRDPRSAVSRPAEAGEEDTLGSGPVSSGPPVPAADGHQAPRPHAWQPPGAAGSRPAGQAASGRPGAQRLWLIAGSALAAAGLIGAGAAIGANLVTGHPAAQPAATSGVGLGPPRGFGPPPGPQLADGKPAIIMNQPSGDGQTIFVIRGVGWPPGARLTVRLVGVGSSPLHPKADSAGIFSYAINQTHEFFAGGLPLATYRVVVTAASGARATAIFQVNHP